jgi:DNA polymerase II
MKPVRGYIVHPTYKIEDGKAFIYLFGRLENGKSFHTIHSFKPYFFIKAADRKKAGSLTDFPIEETDLKTFKEEPVVKVYTNIPKEVPDLRKSFEEQGIICYEADIRFAYRFLMDNNLQGFIEIDGDYEKGESVDCIYKDPMIAPSDDLSPEKIPLKIISLDIETDMHAKKIFSISLVGKDYKKVLIKSDKIVEGAQSFPDEKSLLKAFIDEICALDPDILTGWNVITFDFNVLNSRCKANHIPFIIGRNDWQVKMRVYQDFFRSSTIDVSGRVVLDGLELLRQSFIDLEDYKLETVAQEILGKGKVKIADNMDMRHNLIEQIMENTPEKIVEYNLMDSILVYEILKKKEIISLTFEKSLITGLPMDKVRGSIAALDMLYIKEARKRGFVCPSASIQSRDERVTGGYVKKPNPGIYEYIIVLDFKSLYPSIIRTYNIDPMTLSENGPILAPNGARFKKEQGILPDLIPKLFDARAKAKKQKNDIKSYAIKIIMNSFYGVLANPTCRFYSLELANAITSFARSIVQETAKITEDLGYEVIYGDTDSIFVMSGAASVDESEKIADKIQKHIDEYYRNKVKHEAGRISYLDLEFEKVYKMFLMPRIRGSESGAKKRYAGLIEKNGQDTIDITGLEFVRRDWTEIAKEFQMHLLELLFAKKPLDDYIHEYVNAIKDGKKDDKLIYRKAITKDLDEYTKTTPPHVKAARQLDVIESNIIEYYMTISGAEPVQKHKSPIDYNHYIDKQLRPIAESILVFNNKSFNDIVSGQTQKSLFDF